LRNYMYNEVEMLVCRSFLSRIMTNLIKLTR
jgi:hypothetical protein